MNNTTNLQYYLTILYYGKYIGVLTNNDFILFCLWWLKITQIL